MEELSMFDLITITTPPLSDEKVNHIVWRNGLKENSRDGIVYYDNLDIKNLKQQKGIYIEVGTNRRLKLEGSLHKFYNEVENNERTNYNRFTMRDARIALELLLYEKGIDIDDAFVYNYEIGLNLQVEKDCREYLDKMMSFGLLGGKKIIYVNPKYKDNRVKTTEFPTNARKYHKIYDKVFESEDRKRKVIPDGNILRIETVMRRLHKCAVRDFIQPDNLKKLIESFFRDWNTIQFDRELITPKKTGRARSQLCTEVMSKGKDQVLSESKEKHRIGALTDWEYRNVREFVNHEWDSLKKRITFVMSAEEKEMRELLDINHTILRNEEIIK